MGAIPQCGRRSEGPYGRFTLSDEISARSMPHVLVRPLRAGWRDDRLTAGALHSPQIMCLHLCGLVSIGLAPAPITKQHVGRRTHRDDCLRPWHTDEGTRRSRGR